MLPDGTVTGGATGQPAHDQAHPLGQGRRGDATAPVHPQSEGAHPPTAKQTPNPETAQSHPEGTSRSFFEQAQTRVAKSAWPASVATSTRSENAMDANCGTVHLGRSESRDKESCWAKTETQSATTGSFPKAAHTPVTPNDTNAPGVEGRLMGLKRALERRRLEPLSPYKLNAWSAELSRLALLPRYPAILDGFRFGFRLGVPRIHDTYAPPNHPSVTNLLDVYTSTIDNEFASGRYIGPFTREQVEAELGPFQTSPLSFVPKTSKPGKYRAIHNFSFPHTPSPETTSINSHIISEHFPCTWGTFDIVTLLIARLPPGSQASVRDVAEAYRTIPARPSQWPGLVTRLQDEDQYAINVCNNFGLTSAGGVYGMVADAGADIFRGNGIGPMAKWVDDHLFIRVPRELLPAYNAHRAQWNDEITQQGGRQQQGSRIWYGGKNLPNGSPEEFDEDCSAPFQDLASASPRSVEDQAFAYADADIDALSNHLGIRWEPSKTVPFGTEIPYLGFLWNLEARTVCLLEKKRVKYLMAINEWEEKRTHDLLEMQQLHGKLQHASLVILPGRAYLTSMEAMLATCHNRPFLPRTPPRDTSSDLGWWKQRLSQPDLPQPIPEPKPLTDHRAYSDASSEIGIGIVIGLRWQAWRLAPGWKSQGRGILWAEAIGFELLVIYLLTVSSKGDHLQVYGDNRGVVEGWRKKSSPNKPTNKVFRLILNVTEKGDRTVHTRYVPSATNPADGPSRGVFPPHELRLDELNIPNELRPFLLSFEPQQFGPNRRFEAAGASIKA